MKRLERIIMALLVAALVATWGYSVITTANAQEEQRRVLTKKQKVVDLFDNASSEAIDAIQDGLQDIQAELNSLYDEVETPPGNRMNAQLVLLNKLEGLWQVKFLTVRRDQLMTAGYADGDPIIEAIEDKIVALDPSKAEDFGR